MVGSVDYLVTVARLPTERKPAERGGQRIMKWVKPEFEDISLCMEVTAYVNVAGK
ncbi:MAG: pyrroloquinoline quinone precursor peptide PqqA [Methylacidiphilaceae bacterium]|nr:pyrroloquinoline quinone precursor peptide PqqA [Candidatus Methylacidiphilaceae bacterium]